MRRLLRERKSASRSRPLIGRRTARILPERVLAGLIEVDDAHLIALAEDAQRVALHVVEVQADQLRNPQPAVEKQRQDAVVALAVLAVDGIEQGNTLIERQIARQRLHQLGGSTSLQGFSSSRCRLLHR